MKAAGYEYEKTSVRKITRASSARVDVSMRSDTCVNAASARHAACLRILMSCQEKLHVQLVRENGALEKSVLLRPALLREATQTMD